MLDRACRPNCQDAAGFLHALDPHSNSFCFQTFDDVKGSRNGHLAKVLHLPAAKFSNELLALHAAGAGCYVTVNETDGKGRKTQNITRVRAIWQEDDEGFDGEFPLEPSMEVETSDGHFHRYWLVADDWPADEQGRADFAAVMERMVATYGSDNTAKDISRVLRVPGFYHQKGEPRMVRLVAETGKRYTRAEILAAFPPIEKTSPTKNGHSAWRAVGEDAERIRNALRAIPSDDRDIWLRIGMALKSELGDAGFPLWREWSQSSIKFDQEDCQTVWRSIKPEGGVTIATLFGLAGDHGWRSERAHHNGVGGGHARGNGHTQSASRDDEWSAPKPLPNGLAPVAPFDLAFIPESIAAWVGDISDRMQCPPDLVAIPAVTALGSMIGRKLGIRPEMHTDWIVVPNVWGVIVARPGAMKSPAMEEALKPVKRLEKDARLKHDAALKANEGEKQIFKIKQAAAKDAVKEGAQPSVLLELQEPEAPKAKRYITNDSSYEKLGEILATSGRGILVERDELISLLRTLDQEESAGARGFYQIGWNGTSGYAFDRIVRGSSYVPGVCVSVLGAAQPGPLAAYVRQAVAGGLGDDGLIQRFGLLVWPDQVPGEWRNVDRWADSAARVAAWNAYRHLDELTPDTVLAQRDEFEPEGVPFLDDAAHDIFLGWRKDLESLLRTTELHPALISHFSKYRKLVPALALISHLADRGAGPVSEGAMLRTVAFVKYLATHARRVYGAGTEAEAAAAKAILSRIRKGGLADRFTAREIYRAGWSNLSDRNQVQSGLDLLVDLDWIAAEATQTGGRAKVLYRINPRACS